MVAKKKRPSEGDPTRAHCDHMSQLRASTYRTLNEWNSSRLEGNTYSLLETKRLIELGESAAGKDASEAQMINLPPS